MILEPLIGDMPLVGALSIFFLRKPVSSYLMMSCFSPSLGSNVHTQKDKVKEQDSVLKSSLSVSLLCALSKGVIFIVFPEERNICGVEERNF